MKYVTVDILTANIADLEGYFYMTNTVDELMESLVAATVNNEVKWSKKPPEFQNWFYSIIKTNFVQTVRL